MTISISLLLVILIAHWVADFLLQSDKMALNKSKSWWWLFLHSATYSCVLLFFFGLLSKSTMYNTIIWVALNGGSHFIIDALSSRLTTYLYKTENRHWFFVTIGFDQLLHLIILVGTASVFL